MKRNLSLRSAAAVLACGAASAQTTTRVSVAPTGIQGDNSSFDVKVSDDGRWVVFCSRATNLVSGDTNGAHDIFLRDLQNGVTSLVSVASSGAQGDSHSYAPSLSRDGRFIVFGSHSSNLVSNDEGHYDVFLRDRQSATTEMISVASSGEQSDRDSSYNVPAPTWPYGISDDGRFVAFFSFGTNLVPGDTNGLVDVFVRDRWAGTTECASVSSTGSGACVGGYSASLSGDGRFVAFSSRSDQLVAGDTNQLDDAFVRDRQTGAFELVSVSASGGPASGNSYAASLSADGRYVVFQSGAPDLVPGDTNGTDDVFVRDRALGSTELISKSPTGATANGSSQVGVLSSDTRFVVFTSLATNLVPGDANGQRDVFRRDRASGVTELVSLGAAGAPGNLGSGGGGVTADGALVAFSSAASNLVSLDTNGCDDVFVRTGFGCLTPESYCAAKVNSAGCLPSIAGSGTASASAGSGFLISALQVLEQRNGILAYGVTGPAASPWVGGRLCVSGPRRTPPQFAAANGAPPCVGTYACDFNALIASGVDSSLVAGQRVWAQYWSRDPAAPFGIGLTNGLTFVICP